MTLEFYGREAVCMLPREAFILLCCFPLDIKKSFKLNISKIAFAASNLTKIEINEEEVSNLLELWVRSRPAVVEKVAPAKKILRYRLVITRLAVQFHGLMGRSYTGIIAESPYDLTVREEYSKLLALLVKGLKREKEAKTTVNIAPSLATSSLGFRESKAKKVSSRPKVPFIRVKHSVSNDSHRAIAIGPLELEALKGYYLAFRHFQKPLLSAKVVNNGFVKNFTNKAFYEITIDLCKKRLLELNANGYTVQTLRKVRYLDGDGKEKTDWLAVLLEE